MDCYGYTIFSHSSVRLFKRLIMEDNVRKFISLSAWLVAILFVLQLIIFYDNVGEMLVIGSICKLVPFCLGCISRSILISSLVMFFFNKYVWKWKFIKLLHNVPVLKTEYIGTFTSTYDNEERQGTMYVNQTFLSVTIQLKTTESRSRSILASLENYQGVYHLVYVYQNEPRAEIQEKSQIHYGTAILDVSNIENLEGNYFTSRKTTDSMSFHVLTSELN